MRNISNQCRGEETQNTFIDEPNFITVLSMEKKNYVELTGDENAIMIVSRDKIIKVFQYHSKWYMMAYEDGFFVIRAAP